MAAVAAAEAAAVAAAEAAAVAVAVAVAVAALVEEAVPEEAVPLAAGPLALELVLDQVAALVAGREAEAIMLSDILSPVNTDGLTGTGSARAGFGFEGIITFGMAAGLALGLVTLLVGFANARPSRVGMCGGKRRTSAMSTGLTRIRG